MGPRLVSVVIVGAVLVGGAAVLFTVMRPRSAPAVAPVARSLELPRPSGATAPSSEAAAPAESKAPAEPRRRAATAVPGSAAVPAATPEPAAIDVVTLHVDSDVPDAQVFVDRIFLGTTPLTTNDVKAGAHRLNVSAPGFEGVARDIDVKAGAQDVTVKLREVHLDASIDVVHKHRIGSCKGRLVATPQGIRYDTADKGDAFSATLADLDTFEVDYLEKNLRVKSKAGKRYDFTDPDGNADRLFVFHRDVQKARERLQKGDTPAAP